MDNIMSVPENLNAINRAVSSAAKKYFRAADHSLQTSGIYTRIFPAGNTESADRKALEDLREALGRSDDITFRVATASEQSGGKSTASNVILCYPLLPESAIATTACATEIRYGKEPSLQIRYYANPIGADEFEDGPIFRSDSINKSIWNQLKDFAADCAIENVIIPEHLQYFAERSIVLPGEQSVRQDFSANDLAMSMNDPRHVIVLLLILFTIYVGQNDDEENIDPARKKLCERREKIMSQLGVNASRDFSVLVRWNHPALEQGLIIVDLPGLGSSAGEKNNPDGTIKRSHSTISIEYMNIVDAIFLFFDKTAADGGTSQVLKTFLDSESLKYVKAEENRVIPVMNKVDLPGGIFSSLNAVRKALGNLNPPCIYPISAIAGEYQFVRDGLFPIQRTKKYHNGDILEFLRMFLGREPSDDEISEAIAKRLKNDYEKKYPFKDLNGTQHEINLGEWIRMVTTDYLDRLRALKILETVNKGVYAYSQIVNAITMRIEILKTLKHGGYEMAEALAKSIEACVTRAVTRMMDKLSEQLTKLNFDIQTQIADTSTTMANKYSEGFRKVESGLEKLIRTAAGELLPNVFGNYITDPDAAFIEDGKRRARNNRNVIERLIQNMKNFPVVGCFIDAEGVVKGVVNYIQAEYDRMLETIFRVYNELTEQTVNAMDQEYSEVAEKYGGQFNEFYKSLFTQLRALVKKKIVASSAMARKMIEEDTNVVKMLNEILDKVSLLSVQVQSAYRNATERYINILRSNTIVGSPSFDTNALLAQASIPFFSTDATNDWIANSCGDIAQFFTSDTTPAFDQFNKRVQSVSKNVISEQVAGLSDFIGQVVGGGQHSIDNEITRLSDGISSIRRNIRDMLNEIQTQWDELRQCAWAVREIEYADSERKNILSDSDGGK